MDEETREELVSRLAAEKLGGTSYGEIRSRLSASGMGREEISRLIREVDEKVLEETVTGGRVPPGRSWYLAGMGVAIAGLVLTLLYNRGLVFRGLHPWVVYAPFFAGLVAMFYGRILQKRPKGKDTGRPGPIRRRRPFK